MSSKIITIFGSSHYTEKDPQYQDALRISRALAENGFSVCNGGYRGIMEASARGAHEAGGKTIGITTAEFPGKVNRWISEERQLPTWRDRLFGLIDTGDAYVAFDGATGTLTELFVVWEMTNKKILQKPVILFGEFMQSVVQLLKKREDVTFNDYLRIAKTDKDLLEYLKEALLI